jgi:hypothetical protein
VLGGHCDLVVAVAKGGLDDQKTQIADAVDYFPQGIVGAGIAREHQARDTAV